MFSGRRSAQAEYLDNRPITAEEHLNSKREKSPESQVPMMAVDALQD